MALLNKLKSLLGLDGGQSNSGRQGTDTAGVTVERDPESDATADERAQPETPAPGSEAAEPDPVAEDEPTAEPDSGADPEPSVDPEVDGPSTDGSAEATEDDPAGPESEPMEMVEPESESNGEEEPDPDIGTEPDATSEPEPDVDGNAEPDIGDETGDPEAASGPVGEPSSESVSEGTLREIKGIGPSYATKLSDSGVDSPADLAAADAGELSESTGLSEKRLQGWIDRARSR
ncbi:helix-hairpin-helix domain-containing protein [Halalkalicoccus subterraneus]|uniref:helix-hairpin-helix domain-containing protein n=1 Tax=Halalkalicoccus subterraneus TaxID=2675002 RepID=UPI000EFB5228|nr:helix-hairpin-helix domain-containing protein [Halalkalicoccus subterraneus]